MKQYEFFRQWIAFLKKSRLWMDILGLTLCLGLFFYYAPAEILNSEPATGGDTGSHFWPLVTLVQEALPQGQVRVLNPGNLGGEPHLTHYFPLPYLIMAFLSLFMPLGRAFNVGSILPLVLFPLCIYVCFRGLKGKFPLPLLAATAGLAFLYNESFSMWGGNTLSTLAGQFAHLYAIDFFLLAIGSLRWEFSKRKFPWISVFLIAAVLLSHFYVALYLPLIFVCYLFFEKHLTPKERFQTLLKVGLLALGLATWFVIPMIHNSKWNTAYGLVWGGEKLFNEAFPVLFWPFILISVFFGFCYLMRRWVLGAADKIILPLLIFLILGSLLYYYLFPILGLVDVRIFPLLQLSFCLLAAVAVTTFMRKLTSSVFVWFLTPFLMTAGIWWAARQVHNFPAWLKWNYSGWQAKPAYPDLQKLSESIRGDFSKPRVIYENSDLSNSAGTMRVFEMLPYFAQRSTYESVYMQATILAPAAFYLQALISRTPSCPFPNYTCTEPNLLKLKEYMPMMGVSEIILISEDLVRQAEQLDFLKKKGDFGLWHVFESQLPTSLVSTVSQEIQFYEGKDYKKDFYQWLKNWTGREPLQVIANSEAQKVLKESVKANGNCQPKLDVNFSQMTLTTDCPGQLHIVRFAYHPTWKTDTGDSLYLTSPGFMTLIPSKEKVVFTWGKHWLWFLSDLISWLTLLGSWFLIFRSRKA